jgi:hypothetical protein
MSIALSQLSITVVANSRVSIIEFSDDTSMFQQIIHTRRFVNQEDCRCKFAAHDLNLNLKKKQEKENLNEVKFVWKRFVGASTSKQIVASLIEALCRCCEGFDDS